MKRLTRLIAIGAFGVCVACARSPVPMWARPTLMPVDRVIENLKQTTEDHPDDQEAFVNLGRAYSYKLKFGITEVRTFNFNDSLSLPRRDNTRLEEGKGLSPEQRVEVLANAIDAFHAAIGIDPNEPLPYLGMADLLHENSKLAKSSIRLPYAPYPTRFEQFDRDAYIESMQAQSVEDLSGYLARYLCHRIETKIGRYKFSSIRCPEPDFVDAFTEVLSTADPDRRKIMLDSMQTYWDTQVTEYYLKAFMLSYPKDAHRREQPIRGIQDMIAWEAGNAYIQQMTEIGIEEYDRARVKVVRAGVEALKDIPRSNAITPIIFSLHNDAPLESLLAPETSVDFDLDGTGRDQAWPWLAPETSILVWDPEETGEITSGRQLFGSVTWWLFFDNGYHAMDALDDNRDGELSGDELAGLALWTDANSNGVSDPGEVVPITDSSIEAISCRATDEQMGMPANLNGLRMNDGRVLPTYDWVTEPIQTSTSGVVEESHVRVDSIVDEILKMTPTEPVGVGR